jgi:hypothetical protein
MTPTASYFLRPSHTRISLPLDLPCPLFDGESLSFADRDPKANLSIGMQQLNGIFTQSFHRRDTDG